MTWSHQPATAGPAATAPSGEGYRRRVTFSSPDGQAVVEATPGR